MNAVIYCRVSTKDQVENFSLSTQKAACIDFCTRKNLKVDRVFNEEGRSAKTADRPQLHALLAYCQQHRKQISHVVVYSVSRLARQTNDHLLIRAALKKLGITVCAVTETFDDSASGTLMETLFAALAQFDNDQKAIRTVEGMRAALASGRWTFQAPLGYVTPPATTGGSSLIPDPDRAHLVQHAFEIMATGRRRVSDALKEITALGLRTKRGGNLTPQTFSSMLRNPVYCGRIRVRSWNFDGPGDFEALVSGEAFCRVQAVLDGKRPGAPSRHRDHPDFPLRRFVRCDACQRPLTGSWSKGRNGRFGYYRCPNSGCKGVNIRKEVMETLFIDALASLRMDSSFFALFTEIVRDAWKDRHGEILERRLKLERRLTDLAQRKNTLIDAYLYRGKVDEATYDQQRARLDGEMEAVQHEHQAADGDGVDVEPVLAFAETVVKDPAGFWARLDPGQRPRFQSAVYPNGLRFRGSLIGTGDSSMFFKRFEPSGKHEEGMASPTGGEFPQNTPKTTFGPLVTPRIL